MGAKIEVKKIRKMALGNEYLIEVELQDLCSCKDQNCPAATAHVWLTRAEARKLALNMETDAPL